MSKLYNKYLFLKKENPDKLYLFKSGIFYIFLDDDAKVVSEALGLKLTNLNESIVKCGFPCSNLSKYLELLNNSNLDYKIVDENLNAITKEQEYLSNVEATNIIESIKKIDINKLTPISAFTMICKFKDMLDGSNMI